MTKSPAEALELAELESPTMVNGKREIIRLNRENAELRAELEKHKGLCK